MARAHNGFHDPSRTPQPNGVAPSLQYDFEGLDVPSIKHSLANHMTYTVGKDSHTATQRDWLHTIAYMVRDRLTERWMETMRNYYRDDSKRVYYFSLEFLMGRSLTNSLINLGFYEETEEALKSLGLNLEEIADLEFDAALGNGGLGRLAACFLDSLATLRMPGYGYGIRYEYGMFRQAIENGQQVEHPDNWLRYGNPWEYPRPEVLFSVRFGGNVVEYKGDDGKTHHHWTDTEEVMAMAYDTPIPGYGVETVNNMRLWAAKATRDFDLRYFNEGNYIKAVEDKNHSETLSKVLYPNDTTEMGKELRLRQQYFFVSASIQDILFRYLRDHNSLYDLPNKIAIQLNDTHPTIAIAELMHQLVDIHELPWSDAWDITTRTYAYTNHTLLPEALETWPVSIFERLLPRHLQIIYLINHQFLNGVMHRYPGDLDRMRRMSIIDEEGERRIRMAHLAIIGSHKVNGVAKLHSDLLKETLFKDFNEYFPDKFINVTNGITPRRWLNLANRTLATQISSHIGHEWVTHLDQLEKITPLANDAGFRAEFLASKQQNKEKLAGLISNHLDITVNPSSLFDVQIKRIHEYKRQLLNILHVITLYNRLRDGRADGRVARTVIIAGKAAPGYALAKLVIRLICDVADIINHDPQVHDQLKVVFIPNYDVSTATDVIPASDLSQQISTAGTEASGTGNMKLALNGALTIGTLDGANVEIKEAVGEENIFIFGNTVEQVRQLKSQGYNPYEYLSRDEELKRVLQMIGSGYFSPMEPGRYQPIIDALTQGGDRYLLLADYRDYVNCQERVDQLYQDPQEWSRRAIINIAKMGRFSSDRTIEEYARNIWGISPTFREM